MKKECKCYLYSREEGLQEYCSILKRKLHNDDICKICIHNPENKKEDNKNTDEE